MILLKVMNYYCLLMNYYCQVMPLANFFFIFFEAQTADIAMSAKAVGGKIIRG